jgi:hypothetical protein
MANGLCLAERHGKLTDEQTEHGLRQLEIITVSGIQISAEGASMTRRIWTWRGEGRGSFAQMS